MKRSLASDPAPIATWSLLGFRVFYLAEIQQSPTIQKTTNTSFSGGLTWNPHYTFSFNPRFGLGASLGGAMMLGTTKSLFPALEYQLLVNYDHLLPNLRVEAGGGGQTWFTSPSFTGVMFSANFLYHLTFWGPHTWLSILDQVFLSYSLFNSPSPTHQMKLGVQLTI